ncbi:MAG: GDP-mannose 4,6-dehydratase [Acidobacteriota bacterium]|nr:GDP-mannose 4,6-dehydratase [Acidobacteriota bacterium]
MPAWRDTPFFSTKFSQKTGNGTAIRDYIHVTDLGQAHILALKHLRSGQLSECVNLGNGQGYSVMEVIEAARQVTGLPSEVKVEPARAGAPSRLIANAEKAHAVLGWQPKFPELATIIRTAWDWHWAYSKGYTCCTY